MREIVFKNQLKRDLKRAKRRGKDVKKVLGVAKILATQGLLPSMFKPHKLSGEWAGYWECHIENNWLLIYGITENEVLLARTGTHADLLSVHRIPRSLLRG